MNCYSYQVVEERAFTKTTLQMPEICKSQDFAKTCRGFSSYLVSRFERSMVQRRYDELPPDTPLAMPDEDDLDLQEVKFDIKLLHKLNLASCSAEIRQVINKTSYNFIETFNINLNTKYMVTFNELFEDANLAAMLCARAIEDKYREYGTKNLQAVVTLTEVMPSNFIIRPDGLEFIFSPGLVKTGNNAEHYTVTLDKLEQAQPHEQWFPGFKNKVKKREPLKVKIDPLLPPSIQELHRQGKKHFPPEHAKKAEQSAPAAPAGEQSEQASEHSEIVEPDALQAQPAEEAENSTQSDEVKEPK
ncbi:MAG: hypothetical protein K6F05_05640 [Succinivibrio sp.]|nr:hypothetical protein [Succinivibrio sp.]